MKSLQLSSQSSKSMILRMIQLIESVKTLSRVGEIWNGAQPDRLRQDVPCMHSATRKLTNVIAVLLSYTRAAYSKAYMRPNVST